MKNEAVVVTGATGNIGSRVVLHLAGGRREAIVAFVRDLEKARHLERAGAILRNGSFEDGASLREAFADADTVVLNTAGERLAEHGIAALRAAQEVGVRKIVRVSSGRATTDGPTESTRQHARVDDAVRASGLAFVILRSHSFMQNLLFGVGGLRHSSAIYSGAGSAKIGFIDARDVADAVSAASVSDVWNGQTLDLTGPASLDYAAVAMSIGRALDRAVAYVSVSPEQAGEAARSHGATAWDARAITEFAMAAASGWSDYTTDHVRRLTGHEPRSMDDFVRDELVPAMRS